MELLTKQQESFCENIGLFGVMTSIACLIQHLIFMLPHWITFVIIGVYILCITGFALLMKKDASSPLLLLVSAVLVFLSECFMILSLTFSLVILILLLYLTVVVTLLYMDGIEKQLKRKTKIEEEEAAKWNNVL